MTKTVPRNCLKNAVCVFTVLVIPLNLAGHHITHNVYQKTVGIQNQSELLSDKDQRKHFHMFADENNFVRVSSFNNNYKNLTHLYICQYFNISFVIYILLFMCNLSTQKYFQVYTFKGCVLLIAKTCSYMFIQQNIFFII